MLDGAPEGYEDFACAGAAPDDDCVYRGRAPSPPTCKRGSSGACLVFYHATQGPAPLGFFPSLVPSSLHAGLRVLGKRGLTPGAISHGVYRPDGDPRE
jgi:hypothetical protein